MNETLQVIQHRRSIRRYKRERITNEEIKAVIEAGLYTPSARNRQEWHFTVVTNDAMLAKMKQIMREAMLNSGIDFLVERASTPGFVALHDAPVLIIISGDKQSRYIELDCGAAAQNIMLAAESMGIGSCILASSELIFKSEQGAALKDELGIPDEYSHICSITLGYKDCDDPLPAPRKEGLVNYI
jgi:nitroreductase